MINTGRFNDVGLFKVFSARTKKGNYYVQRMSSKWGGSEFFRVMKDRKCICGHDFEEEEQAIAYLLGYLRGELCHPVLDFNL